MHIDLTPIWYQQVDLIGLYAHGMEEWNGVRQSTYDLTLDLLLKLKDPSSTRSPAHQVNH